MRDYTHAIAVSFVDKMNEYRGYTESERIVITYGLELFLNNNLKLMIYLIIGSVCNIFTETVIAVLVMAVLRILTGGYHSQSDFGCLILTGSMIFIPIILSKYVFISHMHFIVFSLGITVIYILYAPCGGKYSNVKGLALLWIKTVVTLILFWGYLGGIFINRRWGIIVMLVSLMQGLSLIKMKRRISDE